MASTPAMATARCCPPESAEGGAAEKFGRSGESNARKRFVDAIGYFGIRKREVAGAKCDVIKDGLSEELALRQLCHVAHLRSELAAARKVGGVDTVNAHGSRVGNFERARELDGGRLARARMSDERGKAAAGTVNETLSRASGPHGSWGVARRQRRFRRRARNPGRLRAFCSSAYENVTSRNSIAAV